VAEIRVSVRSDSGSQVSFTWPGGTEAIGPTLVRIGRAAEDAGLDTVWVMDRLFQLEGFAEQPRSSDQFGPDP
jgi:alkanesulfonate monooxygenase SsuD/methylene tetrahydromethanopterin reductase-like flavin-dependent oxidoreductase (luciferase family)